MLNMKFVLLKIQGSTVYLHVIKVNKWSLPAVQLPRETHRDANVATLIKWMWLLGILVEQPFIKLELNFIISSNSSP